MRSAGSDERDGDGLRLRDLDEIAALGLLLLGGFLALAFVVLLGLDDVDAHLVQHRQNVFDLLRIDLFGGQHGVQFGIGDKAALLGGLDHPLDGGVRQIEQGAVRGFHHAAFRLCLLAVLFRHQWPPPLNCI